ncbi:MAG TPA: winged helix-turn-helix domain-containing protein [Solirubrobacterales bacterium]|nr:winged helix-turn-helix domain-containing protein [Solirubrobacterales bacterium]
MANRAGRRAARENRLIALSNPLRAEILRILVERPASPVEMARELGVPTPNVSHHAKRLVELDCAELVEEEKVQGAMKHIYRATERVLVDTSEWEEMHPVEAQSFNAVTMQAMIDDFVAAERAQTVGGDRDFHLSRTPMVVDQQGLEESLDICECARLALADVERRSAERGGEEDSPRFRISSIFGIFKIPGSGKQRLSD